MMANWYALPAVPPARTWPTVAAVAVACLIAAGSSHAHGKHHPSSPIQPAYDCFKYMNPETGRIHTTQHNIEVTHDRDLGLYVKWRCHCVETTEPAHPQPKWVCWWKEVGRWKALKNVTLPSGPRWHKPYLRVKWVSWMAHPRLNGCHPHRDRRSVIVVARRR